MMGKAMKRDANGNDSEFYEKLFAVAYSTQPEYD